MVSFFMEKKISGGKKVITWLKKHLAFDKNKGADIQLKESTRALKNPGCGWYHIYTFDLSKENFLYIDCEEEELAWKDSSSSGTFCRQLGRDAWLQISKYNPYDRTCSNTL